MPNSPFSPKSKLRLGCLIVCLVRAICAPAFIAGVRDGANCGAQLGCRRPL